MAAIPKAAGTCEFCSMDFSDIYTCARCRRKYCGLKCFRSKGHNECSNRFYQEQIAQHLREERTKDSDDESEEEEAELSNADSEENVPESTSEQPKTAPTKPRTFAQYMNDHREEDLRKTEAELNPEIPLGEDEELVIDPDDEPEYLQNVIADSMRDYEKMDEKTLNKKLAKMNLTELDEAKLLKMLSPDELKVFQRMADEMFNIPNQSCFK